MSQSVEVAQIINSWRENVCLFGKTSTIVMIAVLLVSTLQSLVRKVHKQRVQVLMMTKVMLYDDRVEILENTWHGVKIFHLIKVRGRSIADWQYMNDLMIALTFSFFLGSIALLGIVGLSIMDVPFIVLTMVFGCIMYYISSSVIPSEHREWSWEYLVDVLTSNERFEINGQEYLFSPSDYVESTESWCMIRLVISCKRVTKDR